MGRLLYSTITCCAWPMHLHQPAARIHHIEAGLLMVDPDSREGTMRVHNMPFLINHPTQASIDAWQASQIPKTSAWISVEPSRGTSSCQALTRLSVRCAAWQSSCEAWETPPGLPFMDRTASLVPTAAV